MEGCAFSIDKQKQLCSAETALAWELVFSLVLSDQQLSRQSISDQGQNAFKKKIN